MVSIRAGAGRRPYSTTGRANPPRELSAAGARGEAVDVWREAYRICVERDDPAIEEVRSLLGDQTAPPIA
ncbi:hypothetical protein K1T35_22045 [Pseudonocardia sp. DSM 110487]|uniref:hypothetical protein n=1 Tax=Pseudonocardia sp. DSM 110487 TaxID=2865833 RepID=UPI001C698031|nr:hypothetical protein [Pseudonocardia sp. DSM 110487]QYN39641.1 hypothetical protein K1T35_22045 [Pseudonocardia sp. DSM 110487]